MLKVIFNSPSPEQMIVKILLSNNTMFGLEYNRNKGEHSFCEQVDKNLRGSDSRPLDLERQNVLIGKEEAGGES